MSLLTEEAIVVSYIAKCRVARTEGKMSIPLVGYAGWQTIFRRIVEWQQKIHMRGELMIRDYDPDLPLSRAEVRLAVQKWSWQTATGA